MLKCRLLLHCAPMRVQRHLRCMVVHKWITCNRAILTKSIELDSPSLSHWRRSNRRICSVRPADGGWRAAHCLHAVQHTPSMLFTAFTVQSQSTRIRQDSVQVGTALVAAPAGGGCGTSNSKLLCTA